MQVNFKKVGEEYFIEALPRRLDIPLHLMDIIPHPTDIPLRLTDTLHLMNTILHLKDTILHLKDILTNLMVNYQDFNYLVIASLLTKTI